MASDRSALISHVLEVQEKIRTCEGCGLCCTEAYNSVAILPVEAERIVDHLEGLPAARREDLLRRIEDAVRKFGLRDRGKKRNYTCAFLEKDFTCALPFDVKPVACLSFNPVHRERCEMEEGWYDAVHPPLETDNARQHLPARRLPIPLAVRSALERKRARADEHHKGSG